jgi:hypothetical protein
MSLGNNARARLPRWRLSLPPKEAAFFWSGCHSTNVMQNITTELDAGREREFFSVSDVAIKFGISRKSVYRLLERGLLRSSTALRKKMITRASLENFIAGSLQGGTR